MPRFRLSFLVPVAACAAVGLAHLPAVRAADADDPGTAAPTGAVDWTPKACAQCHGPDGQGDAAAGGPRIAGQSPRYLTEQLKAFAADKRHNDQMTAVARQLTDEAMHRLADHFGGLETPAPRQQAGQVDRGVLARGGVLAAIGDEGRRVQACQNCHGPSGSGLGGVYPGLAGQQKAYLAGQLRAFRSGKRPGGPEGVMAIVARHLTDDDIDAVAAYYAALPPSSPEIASRKTTP